MYLAGSVRSKDFSIYYPNIKQLNQTILKYMAEGEEPLKKAAFHQALLDAGLVKQIKHLTYEAIAEISLIQVEGEPVSETIIESRR